MHARTAPAAVTASRSPPALWRQRLVRWLAGAALVCGGPQLAAHAATLDLQLHGVAQDAAVDTFDVGGVRYETWLLSLSGLDAFNPATVAVGDVVHANILLDQPITVLGSTTFTFVQLMLGGDAFPAVDTNTTGTSAFFTAGVPGLSGGSSCATSTQLTSCFVLYPPLSTAFTFDQMTSDFKVDVLARPALLERATFYIGRVSVVPEPAAGALWLAGLGAIFTLVRRRSP